MRSLSPCLGCLAALLLVLNGCGDGTTEEKTKSPPVVRKTKTSGGKTKAVAVLPNKQKPQIAKVLLSATCLVKQDGQFPDAKLKDLAGADRAISQLRGEQATVVLFWSDHRTGRGALHSMVAHAAREMPGVRYVGVYVGDEAQEAKAIADKAMTPFPVLVDRDRSLFKQVIQVPDGQEAADVLPRVYLLDPASKVLWLSLAFQQLDEGELDSALEFLLEKEAPGGKE